MNQDSLGFQFGLDQISLTTAPNPEESETLHPGHSLAHSAHSEFETARSNSRKSSSKTNLFFLSKLHFKGICSVSFKFFDNLCGSAGEVTPAT